MATMIYGNKLFQHWMVSTPARIRPCVRADLPKLEWYGMFAPHQGLIQEAFERQEKGENLMLVAEVNDFPAGQIWIDLVRKRAEAAGVLWAMRVFPAMQMLGIGSRLLQVAEGVLAAGHYDWAELSVTKENPSAKQWYERRGYRVMAEEINQYNFTTPDGFEARIAEDAWVMRKPLAALSGEFRADGGGR